MKTNSKLPIAVIGAGPVGLALKEFGATGRNSDLKVGAIHAHGFEKSRPIQ